MQATQTGSFPEAQWPSPDDANEARKGFQDAFNVLHSFIAILHLQPFAHFTAVAEIACSGPDHKEMNPYHRAWYDFGVRMRQWGKRSRNGVVWMMEEGKGRSEGVGVFCFVSF